MKIFKNTKEKSLVTKNSNEREIVVAVPDIKEYLVKEYERVNNLKLINEGLEQQLEEAREIKLRYEATLVTLDEYSKRLESAESQIKSQRHTTDNVRAELRAARDEVNSYKIKFNNAAITKAELEREIVDEVKQGIISKINSCKGNLSKKIVCEIISSYEKE